MRSLPAKLSKQPKNNLGKRKKGIVQEKAISAVDPRRMNADTTPSRGFIKICTKCGAVFYDKKWYAKEELAGHLAKRKELKGGNFERWFKEALKEAKRVVCEADKQHKDFSEGVVILENLNPKIKQEVLNLVKNINQEGRKNDVEDKIVAIEDHGNKITIYTSENQLAHRIGKQVASAFKGGKLTIKFSDQEDATRVYWQAPEASQ
jgi:NMD protein affecting ribosome stability and mRNA decay